MGASGAGKTSLLNILAGRAQSGGRIKIEGDVRLNNYSVDPTSIKVRKSIAFVAQDDSLQSTATPREAIRFSAKLRLPRSTTDSQLDMLATRMLDELGLSACADTIVGGPLIKGISGGERKRASVGVELVVVSACAAFGSWQRLSVGLSTNHLPLYPPLRNLPWSSWTSQQAVLTVFLLCKCVMCSRRLRIPERASCLRSTSRLQRFSVQSTT